MDKMKMHSVNKVDENVEKISRLFPNCVTESLVDGKLTKVVDFDMLKQELSSFVVEGHEERYQFTWPDKRKSVLLANAPIAATLRPVREDESTPTGLDSTNKPYCSSGSVNFDTTENLYIEGDNLDVLKLLQETYLGKIKMIYIDPPYNTGSDFVYEDDFAQNVGEYLANSGQYDEAGNRLVQNTESNGRFHTDWLNMIYPRLKLAKDLLTDDGVIFISIDDNEFENAQKVCNEIFGEKNFIANLIWKSKSGGANDSKFFAVDHEYIFVYAKNAECFTLNIDKEATVSTSYNRKDEFGEYALDRLDKQSIRYSPALDYEIIGPDGISYFPQHKDPNHPNATWRWAKDNVQENMDKLVFEKGSVYTKNYKKEGSIARSLLLEDRFGRTRTGKTDCFSLFGRDYFSNPKPYKLIRFLEIVATNFDSIVLDFFSGSATTAHAVMQLNAEDSGHRKFIMVQLPEVTDEDSEAYNSGYKNICEIGKERIRRAGAKIKADSPLTTADLDIGFRVLKLDNSNMKDVYYTPDEHMMKLFSSQADNIKDDRSPEDLLFQVMLDLGIPLSARIKRDGDIFYVNGNYLIACFNQVSMDMITKIAKQKPYYAVFRDGSFLSDSDMANFEQVFNTYSPSTTRRVL